MHFKKFRSKLILTLIVKSVNSVDGGTLVVTAQQKEVFWVFDLQRTKLLNPKIIIH